MGQSRSKQRTDVTTEHIVLLGQQEKGKSTFFNQLLNHPPLEDTMELVFQWCLSNIRKMIAQGALNRDEMDSMKRELEQDNELDMFRALTGDYELSGGLDRMSCLKRVVWDGYLRKMFSQYKFYNGFENMGFVMNHLEEPLTGEVCSMVYTKSTTFHELNLSENEIVLDVGSPNETRNWIRGLENLIGYLRNVKMVFFFASLIEFDQVCSDDSTNRMNESVERFKELSNSNSFKSTRVVLILTKPDLLVEKMTRFRSDVDLSQLDLQETVRSALQSVNKDVQPIVEAIVRRYEKLLNNKRLEFHIVNTTNQNEVKTFMENVRKGFMEPFISPSLKHNLPNLQTKLHLAWTNTKLCDIVITTITDEKLSSI